MTWLKLGIPILLGIAAGAINWVAMSSVQKPEEFVRLSADLRVGQAFTEDNLEKVAILGDLGSRAGTAVRWEERTKVLFGKQVVRDLNKGDLVLWRDILPAQRELNLAEGEEALPITLEGVSMPPQLIQVDDRVSFIITRPDPRPAAELLKDKSPPRPRLEVLGPFRVVTVGDILTRRAGDDSASAGEARAAQQRALTIALKRKGNDIEDRNIVELLQARLDERTGQKRIVELVLSPRRARGK